jgi:asparagine N-glycosylation enzyme membrane subunit Stt3
MAGARSVKEIRTEIFGARTMNLLFIIIIIIAVILALTGGFVSSLNFLLWVGIVLLVIAVIAWLIRSLSGRSRA